MPRVGRKAAVPAVGIFCLGVLAFAATGSLGAPPAPPAARDSHCTGKITRAAVSSFVVAFNRGAYEGLDTLFAKPPSFQWYSSPSPGRRTGPGARNRSTLVAYLRHRHEAGDRLALLSFDFNGDTGRYGNFGLDMRRSAPGFRDGDWFRLDAKGALVCEGDSVEFIVFSFGAPKPPRQVPATARARS